MWGSKRSGSVLCPGCGSLVGVRDERCYTCGRLRPGLWGLTSLLRRGGSDDLGFLQAVTWACGALYLATLVVSVEGIHHSGLLGLFAPDSRALVVFGASGAVPVFGLGRWWTVLSAGWLHGSAPHILFNMLAARTLIPAVAQLYGAARTVILWVVACATGFLVSSLAGQYLAFAPSLLRGAELTVGASASIYGLIGALLVCGQRTGNWMADAHAREWALSGVILGVFMPGIDNWAHLGGFLGGWFVARWLDPLRGERGDHMLVALALLLLSASAVCAALVTGLALVRA